ncbi:MAG: hypothetical protein EZS28_024688 [Streblomastix strix]|uniref:Uncharacterized protein n=1 Tax=Streblomastix strix TaxID=222440 RepID=A0A5J4VB73_9EUKA|nr:MAG: hypothetical protein EZS28_024688 [Streblomastix strix]
MAERGQLPLFAPTQLSAANLANFDFAAEQLRLRSDPSQLQQGINQNYRSQAPYVMNSANVFSDFKPEGNSQLYSTPQRRLKIAPSSGEYKQQKDASFEFVDSDLYQDKDDNDNIADDVQMPIQTQQKVHFIDNKPQSSIIGKDI